MKQITSFSKWVKRPLSMQVPLVVFTALATLFFSCQKDILKLDPSVSDGTQLKNPLTVDMAKAWFEPNFGKSVVIAAAANLSVSTTNDSLQDGLYRFNASFQITPLWDDAKISTYLRTQSILLVPVKPIAFLEAKNLDYSLVFFRDTNQNITARLQVFRPFDATVTNGNSPNVSTFSGLLFQINLNGFVQHSVIVENGIFTKRLFLPANPSAGRGATATVRSCRTDPSQCYDFNSGTTPNVFDGGGTITIIIITNTTPPILGFDSGPYSVDGNRSQGGGSSSGNNNSLSSEIDDTLFDVAGETTKYAYYQEIYMFQMGFSDTEFEEMYFDKLLFTKVRHGFGFSAAQAPIIREFVRIYKDNMAFRNATIADNFNHLREFQQFISEGFTGHEFAQLFLNQALFQQLDGYLTRQANAITAWETVKEITGEFKNENYTTDATFTQDVQLHLNLIEQSADYTELCNSLNAFSSGGSGNDPLKAIVLDLMVEAAQEWAENFLGINDLSALRDLLERGTEKAGKLAFRATRIIARFIAKKNPLFNALSSMVKAKEVYDKVNKAYKAFENIKNIGDDIVTKLASILKIRTGKILENIEWLGGNEGGKIKGVSALDVFDDLKRAFGGTSRPGNANEIIFDIYTAGRQIECKLYINSNTPRGEATISFKITGGTPSGLTVKFGFNF